MPIELMNKLTCSKEAKLAFYKHFSFAENTQVNEQKNT